MITNILLKYWKLLLFLAVFYFVGVLAVRDYDRYPYEGHGEEQAFAWAGFSLLKYGSPRSWSHFDYPEENILYSGQIGEEGKPSLFVDIVDKWFDQPPLYALLSGLGPYLSGYEEIGIFPSRLIRLPNIFALLGIELSLFILVRKIYGYWTAIGSMAFFGITPIFIFGGRLSVPEVVFGLLFVLMMIFWLKYKENEKYIWIVLIGTFGGVAGLMKITGFLLSYIFVFFLVREKKYKNAIKLLLFQLPFFLILYLYAESQDYELFKSILFRQGFRPVGWTSLAYIFSSPGYDINNYYDGWFVFSFVSVFLLAFFGKVKDKLILWPIFFWITVVIFTAGQQDMLPWYRYPMYPFLAVAAVRVIQEIYRKPSFAKYLLIPGMLIASRYYVHNAFRADVLPKTFRTSFAFVFSPILLFESRLIKKKYALKIVRGAIVAIILVGAFYNTKLIYTVFSIRCENVFPACYLDQGNWLSQMRLPLIWRLLVDKPL